MSILIKKMEMPKGCWACPFAVGKLYECLFTKKSSNWGLTTRPSDCPLIEIQSPHGRLIDVDALKEEGADIHMDYVCDGYVEDTTWGYSDDLLDSQPTIIEAEGSEE
jgi:hypothetical protein